MKSMTIGWLRHSLAFVAALLAVGFTAPVWAAFELPQGEKITNVAAIPRAIPQKEAYELYDPKIGKNFDVKNFWMRADLRVRPEMRNNVCFGGAIGTTGVGSGACNTPTTGATKLDGKGSNDFYVQQWVRLGIGYDLSPDVNFYMEIIDSAVWGGNGDAKNAGNGGDPLNHNCSNTANGACRLGVRAAYVLVRNLGGVQGLSMKAGRQYVVFGSHSLFGHFDWANSGYSHDGLMFQYSTKAFDSYLGWFRNSEGDVQQATTVGPGGTNVVGNAATSDSDLFIFYNQIKSVPGFLIEPFAVYYSNQLPNTVPAGLNAGVTNLGLGTPKHANQRRYMLGNRIEMRKGNFDAQNEFAYQFGTMGDNGGQNAGNGNNRNLHINAWAMRNWIGYTHYQSAYKPRLAVNLDYASGDGRANCTLTGSAATGCKTANTFENFFPTNHIHMGYMDVQAWKNMMSPSINFQMRPTKDDHFEIWATSLNLANKRDNWYRGNQGVYIYSQANNTKSHIGDEIDITYTRMFAEGKMAFQITGSTLFSGGYIQQNLGTSNNQTWGYAQIWMNF